LAGIHVCVCIFALFHLEKWSSPSVRDDAGEVSFYLIFSLAWIALTQSAFAFFGISVATMWRNGETDPLDSRRLV